MFAEEVSDSTVNICWTLKIQTMPSKALHWLESVQTTPETGKRTSGLGCTAAWITLCPGHTHRGRQEGGRVTAGSAARFCGLGFSSSSAILTTSQFPPVTQLLCILCLSQVRDCCEILSIPVFFLKRDFFETTKWAVELLTNTPCLRTQCWWGCGEAGHSRTGGGDTEQYRPARASWQSARGCTLQPSAPSPVTLPQHVLGKREMTCHKAMHGHTDGRRGRHSSLPVRPVRLQAVGLRNPADLHLVGEWALSHSKKATWRKMLWLCYCH